MLLFQFDEREATIQKWSSNICMTVEVKVFQTDYSLIAEKYSAFDHIT